MRLRLPVLLMIPVVLGAIACNALVAANPTTSYQSADEQSYGTLAVNIAEQRHYGDPASGMRDPLHWPPGAPMLFAAGHALFGEASSLETVDIPVAYWEQALVTTGTVLAAIAFAWLLAGAWAGLVAGALVGFYPPLILYTGEQLSEPLGAFLVMSAVAALAVAERRRSAWACVVAGLLLGAAVLTRADLILAPFLVAALVAGWLALSSRSLRRGLAAGALVAGGALVLMAPWTAYVSERGGEFVPVTRGSASALFVGTYLPGDGRTAGLKKDLADEVRAREPQYRDTQYFDIPAPAALDVIAARYPDLDRKDALSQGARDNLREYAVGDPLSFGSMMVSKAGRMWTRYARGGARHTSNPLRVLHVVIVVVSLAGLLAGLWRGRSPVLGAVLLVLGYSTAVHTIVVSQARYNLPLMPILMAGGVVGWFTFAQGRRSRAEPETAPEVAAETPAAAATSGAGRAP